MLYLTLRQYEYVVAVADCGSVSEAALKVGISQPSLSVAIKQVEANTGAQLFERKRGSKVEVTPFGHRFVAQARALLDQAGELERASARPSPFVFGCFSDIAPWYLGPALDLLRPILGVQDCSGREGRFAELATGLAEGQIQLALSYDVGFGDRFEQRTIRRVPPVAFMSVDHPLAKQSEIHLKDLMPHPLILFSEPESENFMRRLFQDVNLTPEVAQRVTSLELMRSLAAHGLGVGVSYSKPPGTLSYDGQELVTVPIITNEAQADIKLIWSRHCSRDPVLQMAIEALGAGL